MAGKTQPPKNRSKRSTRPRSASRCPTGRAETAASQPLFTPRGVKGRRVGYDEDRSRTMRHLIPAIVAAAAVAAAPAATAREKLDPEAELAKLLEGRVAGEPQKCIRTEARRVGKEGGRTGRSRV